MYECGHRVQLYKKSTLRSEVCFFFRFASLFPLPEHRKTRKALKFFLIAGNGDRYVSVVHLDFDEDGLLQGYLVAGDEVFVGVVLVAMGGVVVVVEIDSAGDMTSDLEYAGRLIDGYHMSAQGAVFDDHDAVADVGGRLQGHEVGEVVHRLANFIAYHLAGKGKLVVMLATG